MLILHQMEARKPTNTGRLALRCLPNGAVVIRGRVDTNGLPALGSGGLEATPDAATVAMPRTEPTARARAVPAWLAEATNPVLLFPCADARPIATFRGGAPITLVVPDGTWGQAASTRHRVPGLERIPAAVLPPGPPSRYRLRTAPGGVDQVCTLEAIARALAVLEDEPGVATELLRVLDMHVERTLWMSGKLSAAEVTGGLPEGVRQHDPLSGPAARGRAREP